MLKSRTLADEEEEFWDCPEDSLSDVSVDGESVRNRSLSTSGYSGSSSSDTDELQSDLQDFAFEELGESAEVSFWSGLDFYNAL